MKFLLMSDVHLDRAFAWAPTDVARRRRVGIRDAFAHGVRLADDLDADALFIGGDLYERDRFSPDSRSFVRDQLCELGRPVYLAPGNHDCHDRRSLYAQVDWPERVTIFPDTTMRRAEVEPGLTLWGAAHTQPGGTGNFFDGFEVDGDGMHLALFHGSLDRARQFEPDEKKPHAPFRDEDLERAGIDHALLGHYHSPRHEERLTYPGNPEPLTFGETGDRGAVEVDVHDDGSVTTTTHDVSQTAVHDLTLDVSEARSLKDVRDVVGGLVEGRSGCARVTLEGTIHPDINLDLDTVAETGEQLDALVVRTGSLEPGYDLDAIRNESNIRGEFVRNVEADEDLSDAQKRRVTVTGLRALDGRRDLEVR